MSKDDKVQIKFTTSLAQREALKAEAYRRGIPTYRLLREQVTLLTGVQPDPVRPYTRLQENGP